MALTLASMMPGREGAGLRDEPAGDRHRPWNAGSSVGLAPVASASGLNKMLRDCFAASAALAVGMSFSRFLPGRSDRLFRWVPRALHRRI